MQTSSRMRLSPGFYGRALALACLGMFAYDAWTLFVRTTPAVAIAGQHRRLIAEFGAGVPVVQAFQMLGNGLNAVDVQFSAETPTTLLVRCELSQIEPRNPLESPTPYAESTITRYSDSWVATIKRVSGVEWRTITFPAVDSSDRRIYALRLQLAGAASEDDVAAARLRGFPRGGAPGVALVASRENVLGGGALWISDRRQIGSLSMRAFALERTGYGLMRAQILPGLPPPLSNPAVAIALVAAYQVALLIVVFTLVAGRVSTAGVER
jgi:hypothetical protein